MTIDEFYMKYAIYLANKGKFTTTPNPNVGCVIVKNNNIVGKGWHKKAGQDHAEIHALNMAGHKALGSTAYINLEPCIHFGRTPPCCNELIKHGVKKVVIALKDPNPKVSGNGIKFLKKFGIDVVYGILNKQAKKINFSYIKRMKTGLPWIQIKLGSSLDGNIAMSNGESKWITSLEARKDAQYFRAQSSAILSTSSTILKDNPKLTVRWQELNTKIKKIYPKKKLRNPIRIILDSKNVIRPSHNIISQPGKNILVRLNKDKIKWPKNTEQLIIPALKNHINIKMLLETLGKKEINYLLVESGSILSGFLLQNGYFDEIIIYLSGKVLGNQTISLFQLKNISKISECINLSFKKVSKIGSDIRLVLTPNKF